MPRSVSALVSRGDELAQAAGILASAAAGEAAAVIVVGDAGVDKTRLVTELVSGFGAANGYAGVPAASGASASGALVLLGHCVHHVDAPPPYLPLS